MAGLNVVWMTVVIGICIGPLTAQAPCPGTPNICKEGKKYPDQSDCLAYYLCSGGTLGPKTQCDTGTDQCATSGLPCTFDIHQSQCVHPDGSFDCYARCTTYIISTEAGIIDTTRFPNISTPSAEINSTESLITSTQKGLTTIELTTAELYTGTTNESTPELTTEDESAPELTTEDSIVTTGLLPEYPTREPAPGCVYDSCNRPPVCIGNEIIAKPSNCSQYYICSFGVWVEAECPLDFLFDNVTCACTIPETAVCQQCEPPLTTTPPYDGECSADACARPLRCVENEITADPDNCAGYYICNFGVWASIDCPLGTYFDSMLCECVFLEASNVTCQSCPTSSTVQSSTTSYSGLCIKDPCDKTDTCVATERTADPLDCLGYQICNFGVWESTRCPDGMAFDNETCQCVSQDLASCHRCGNCISDACERDEVYCSDGDIAAEPDLCSAYYTCSGGSWQIEQCPAGEEFDVYACECRPEGSVQCLECPRAPVGSQIGLHQFEQNAPKGSSTLAVLIASLALALVLAAFAALAIVMRHRKNKTRGSTQYVTMDNLIMS